MPISQERSKRKHSGGRYKSSILKKKIRNKGNAPTLTKLGQRNTQKSRMRAGKLKTRLLTADKVNVFDPKTKKYSREEIKTILENPANPQFVRRNIITKGTIVDTAKGKVRITSRPGQESSLSGVLM